MIFTFLLLCTAAAGLVAYFTSALTGLVSLLGRTLIANRTPAAQGRIHFGLSVAPLVVTVLALGAAVAPAAGWIADHCNASLELHGHPHICMHHESVWPAIPIWLVAGIFLGRVLVLSTRQGWLALSAWRAERRLLGESRGENGLQILPTQAPAAFVLGFFRPSVFISEGLLRLNNQDHTQAVLAHERSHAERRDPLRRLSAGLALSFHLPGVARFLESQLSLAHERAADEVAAGNVGSRTRIAEALVEFARLNVQVPLLSTAFHAHGVEARVKALLRDPSDVEGPELSTLLVLTALFTVLVAASADSVHHGVEMMLGLLGG